MSWIWKVGREEVAQFSHVGSETCEAARCEARGIVRFSDPQARLAGTSGVECGIRH